MTSKILVTGATGPLGGGVVENLLKKINADKITVFVRDTQKASGFAAKGVHVLTGDYDNYPSMLNAFKGINKLYLVSGNDITNRAEQQANVVKAAKEAGVKQLIYTSFQHKNETDQSPIAFVAGSHLSTEKAIKDSGLTYTILQHGLYTDLIPMFAGEKLMETETIYLPAGEGKTAFALRTDFAEAGANVLLETSDKFENKTLELAGSEAVSWKQIAEIISQITGKPIKYVSPSVDEFNKTLMEAGVPAEIVGITAGFNTAIKEGEFENTTNDLERILGRKPISVETFLKSVFSNA